MSRDQKSKTDLDFTEARDSEWQWHQLGHMQICTSPQTDNHACTYHSVLYRPDALPAVKALKVIKVICNMYPQRQPLGINVTCRASVTSIPKGSLLEQMEEEH